MTARSGCVPRAIGGVRSSPLVLALAILASAVPTAARAQSSLTGEFTGPGKVDVSFDFLGSLARHRAGGFEWYLPAIAVGLRDDLEVSAGLSRLVPPSPDEPLEFIPAARWRWLHTSRGTSAAVGGAWHVPTSLQAGEDAYGILHATVAQELFRQRAATLSFGGYTLVDRTHSSDTRRGVIASWDQSVSARWSYAVEWTSGDNWYGYLSITATLTTARHWLSAGYCVGNRPAQNHGPCVSVGRSF